MLDKTSITKLTSFHVKWYQSLVFKFTSLAILLAMIPLAIASYVHYTDSTKSIKNRTYEDLQQSTILQKKFFINWFDYRQRDIKYLSQSNTVVTLMTNLLESFEESKGSLEDFVYSDEYFKTGIDFDGELHRFQNNYDYIYDVFFIDLKGNILYTNEHESDFGTSLISGPYKETKLAGAFKKTLADKRVHFSDLELYKPSNNIVAGFLTAPIMNENSVCIGVLATQIKLDKIYTLFEANKEIQNGVIQTYVVGSDGLLRSPLSKEHTKILKQVVDTKQFRLWKNEHATDASTFISDMHEEIFIYKNSFGEDVLGIHHDIDILGVHWALISELDVSVVTNLQEEIIENTSLIAFLLLLVIISVSIFLIKYLIGPITDLMELVKQFGSGKRDVKISIHNNNEVGVLAEHIDEMIQTIKKSENELDEQKFALNAHSIVAVTDVGGNITYVNSKFEEISGYSKEELIGKNHRILNSKEKQKSYWKSMYETISSGLVWRDEIKNINKQGEEYWVDTSIVPFMNSDGEIVSYVSVRTDITEQKRDELALIEAKKIADESVKAKSEFFASMSHEIRTPMNGIIGMLGLLLKTKLSESQHHQAYLAQTSAQALLNLINDILDFSKFEADKLELEQKAFNIHDDFGDFAESIAFKAQEKGVHVILDMKDVHQKTILGDAYRIRQVLNNIVSNAIKFTHEGYVLITVSLLELNEEEGRLSISVKDTGIGIASDKIAKLFDSFSQVDSSTTRKYGGTGLGLAIVKKLVAIMDGNIDVSSQEGVGSIFSVEIAVAFDKDNVTVSPDEPVNGKKALILDACKKSAEVLAWQLQEWGMEVDTQKDSQHSYDIIFISKDENAFKLGESLKQEYVNARLILMTSLEDTANVSHYTDFIYDTYFSQPTTTQDIFKALRTLKNRYSSNEIYIENQDENSIEFDKNTKILLVDDNKVNQLVALGLLEEFGLDADVANNGLEAIKAVENAIDEPYEIILMDCQMPEMDGYDATLLLKSGEHGESVAKIPIVAMTANAMDGDKEKCFASGMDDYISKPIDPERLEEVLRKYLL
ncbi:MAG TPA: response regulator [Sulfurimonas sp.]|nr:response regulator [Sulfurimonas sp.]